MGKILIIIGAGILVLGVVLNFAPWLLGWFGKLPGDINIETENTRVFVPITSMLIVSVVLSLVLYLIRRF
ncbi:MAG: DUF2905 domain-containing protein [Pyrinomonadaceae bacterium]